MHHSLSFTYLYSRLKAKCLTYLAYPRCHFPLYDRTHQGD